jgi:transposase
MDLATWTQVLGLPDVEVVAVERSTERKTWLLSVIQTCCVALCPGCKEATGCRHLVRWELIHDLFISGREVLLKVQVIQFHCARCGKFFSVCPACVLEDRHVTVRLAEALSDCVNASTLRTAAATYHLPESTVKELFEETVERRCAEKARTLKPIAKLGIDEIHVEVHDTSAEPTATVQPVATQTAASAEAGGKSG